MLYFVAEFIHLNFVLALTEFKLIIVIKHPKSKDYESKKEVVDSSRNMLIITTLGK